MVNLSILVHYLQFTGDGYHPITEAVEPVPGETVEALVARLLPTSTGTYAAPQYDRIELRLMREPHHQGKENERP